MVTFNEDLLIKKIAELNVKDRMISNQLTRLRDDKNVLETILSRTTFDVDEDGELKRDGEGQPIVKKFIPIDKGTSNPITIIRRDEIYDGMMAKADIDLAG